MVIRPEPQGADRARTATTRGNRWVGGKFGTERSPFGVDISGLRARLRLAPAARLARMVDAVRFTEQVRGALTSRQAPQEYSFDPAKLLCHLAAASVEYIVIGGWAAALHGSNYAGDAVEILLAPTAANRARLAAALRPFDARADGQEPAPLGHAEGWDYEWATPWARLRCSDSLAAGLNPQEVRDRAVPVELPSCLVRVIGLDDLIAIQRQRQAPADRLLLEDLLELRKLAAEGAPVGDNAGR